MYSLWDYCRMIEDPVRTKAYLKALRRAITPGCVVVAIGTGTGFFAVQAVRMGARKVYAIEADPAIAAAREVVALNGCADRVELMKKLNETGVFKEGGGGDPKSAESVLTPEEKGKSDGFRNAKITYSRLRDSTNLELRFRKYLQTDSLLDDPYTVSTTVAKDAWYGRFVLVIPRR